MPGAGLAALADSFPERILERLLGEFRGPSRPDREHALETRLKVGEVLMRASRAMGECETLSRTQEQAHTHTFSPLLENVIVFPKTPHFFFYTVHSIFCRCLESTQQHF